MLYIYPSLFFFYSYGDPLDLHSFPTRRSSDLRREKESQQLQRSAEFPLPFADAPVLASPKPPTQPLLPSVTVAPPTVVVPDRKSTRLNSSHVKISYAVFCLKKKKKK